MLSVTKGLRYEENKRNNASGKYLGIACEDSETGPGRSRAGERHAQT